MVERYRFPIDVEDNRGAWYVGDEGGGEPAGILGGVLDGVKEIGDKMEQGYPVLLRKVA